jgi:predicted transcriptional regulator
MKGTLNERKVIRIRSVMKTEIIMVDGLMTVKEALQTMKAKEVRALIIKKRHPDDEYGMLLLSDVAKKVLAQDRSPERVNVYEIMAKPVISVSPQMDIRYCARLFENFGLSYAPVIEQGEVIGIVSYNEMALQSLELYE